ncbi:uncharacterized protein Z519_09701 [Cladophialophora bantiana CBS 173.52]|uniref:Uncharacterized protein n=1 Tax=Cladophialophora bantiana (strain ATCC 10958 / CBS 173.52 / CDC B-1940 / NIH 8579) TaxID=1442370 RepID=A0A0D2HFL7_CLAB1|nr:uncharacterized protein Z519_09701 [Cladophialophora bantiana CBS 173.52]KIW89545.1 hypothetical protein Z519_09701 [Cladophialophora bantiana CBS 173.52]
MALDVSVASISVSIATEEPTSTTTGRTVTNVPPPPASSFNYTSLDKDLTTVTIVDPAIGKRHNIAYFVDQNGQAIVDDDILFSSKAYLLIFQPGSMPLHKGWNGVRSSSVWLDGIIHYKCESDAAEEKHSGPMNEALDL